MPKLLERLKKKAQKNLRNADQFKKAIYEIEELKEKIKQLEINRPSETAFIASQKSILEGNQKRLTEAIQQEKSKQGKKTPLDVHIYGYYLGGVHANLLAYELQEILNTKLISELVGVNINIYVYTLDCPKFIHIDDKDTLNKFDSMIPNNIKFWTSDSKQFYTSSFNSWPDTLFKSIKLTHIVPGLKAILPIHKTSNKIATVEEYVNGFNLESTKKKIEIVRYDEDSETYHSEINIEKAGVDVLEKYEQLEETTGIKKRFEDNDFYFILNLLSRMKYKDALKKYIFSKGATEMFTLVRGVDEPEDETSEHDYNKRTVNKPYMGGINLKHIKLHVEVDQTDKVEIKTDEVKFYPVLDQRNPKQEINYDILNQVVAIKKGKKVYIVFLISDVHKIREWGTEAYDNISTPDYLKTAKKIEAKAKCTRLEKEILEKFVSKSFELGAFSGEDQIIFSGYNNGGGMALLYALKYLETRNVTAYKVTNKSLDNRSVETLFTPVAIDQETAKKIRVITFNNQRCFKHGEEDSKIVNSLLKDRIMHFNITKEGNKENLTTGYVVQLSSGVSNMGEGGLMEFASEGIDITADCMYINTLGSTEQFSDAYLPYNMQYLVGYYIGEEAKEQMNEFFSETAKTLLGDTLASALPYAGLAISALKLIYKLAQYYKFKNLKLTEENTLENYSLLLDNAASYIEDTSKKTGIYQLSGGYQIRSKKASSQRTIRSRKQAHRGGAVSRVISNMENQLYDM